ncbi:polysaccharide pyruvyl transferase family protein [Leptothermofonsia sp. ETS-13]|uniref:polysaccharide pyruvyl transferase family protein n=1 Tax=Leptothermofonsia sp. ETS-13 TaxID=3035696 RepID=UPI003B9F4230
MKIAVFGYYHQLNYGDDRLGQALVHALYPHKVVLFPHHEEPPSMDWFDFILIGGGGLVWARTGIWSDITRWLGKSKKPFGVVGLGINELNADLKPDLLWMVEHSKLFIVRDQKSHQLLDYHPKVKVLPDLTWMIPYPPRAEVPQNDAIAVSLASRHPQGYDPTAWGKLIQNMGEVVPFPLRFAPYCESDIFQKLGFEKVPQEFSIKPLYECPYLIGTRFHSVIFALQIGTPFIAILYDDKVRRLLDDNDLLDLGIGIFDFDKLSFKLDYLKENIHHISERVEKVGNQLRDDGTKLREILNSTIQEVSQSVSVQKQGFLQRIRRSLRT